jgi:hypothetical protein
MIISEKLLVKVLITEGIKRKVSKRSPLIANRLLAFLLVVLIRGLIQEMGAMHGGPVYSGW